ncbi:hypothetical protein ACVIJ6_003836 [Bradyrhizobium sp. USDA 4369]
MYMAIVAKGCKAGDLLDLFSEGECANDFKTSGYVSV